MTNPRLPEPIDFRLVFCLPDPLLCGNMICHLLIKNLTFAKFYYIAGYRIWEHGGKCQSAILLVTSKPA